MKTSRCWSLRGFTLIELLAVIMIVGVLFALSVVSLGRVRDNARQATCASNLRQIGAALKLYANDHKNLLPPVATGWFPADKKATWDYAIWTYAGYAETASNDPINSSGDNIFRCPSTQSEAVPLPAVGKVSSWRGSYGLNSNLNGSNSAGWTTGVNLARVVTPSRTAMVLETSFPLGDSAGYRLWYGLIPHKGATQVLFYDGHVELIMPASMPADETKPFWGKL